MTTDLETVLDWRGRTVRDRDGERIGTLGALYLDGEDDRPAFGGIATGRFGRHEAIVPLDEISADGDDLRVPFDAAAVEAAPRLDPGATLTDDEEDALRAHYRRADRRVAEVTRSEEEVTQRVEPMRPAERVRLRKVLVTENVTQVVPRRREVVQLETDPPPAGRIEHVEDAGPAPSADR